MIQGGNMKVKIFITPFVLLVFALCLLLSPGPVSAQEKKKETQAEIKEQIIIPNEVKVALQEGLAQRQGRLDIPFSFIKHLYLPAQLNMHSVFFFKMKNVDLGFVPQAFALVEQKTEEETAAEEEEKKETPPASETKAPPVLLQANLNVFFQFHRLEEKAPVEVFKEVYIPVKLQVESTSYDPEKEEIYSTAYPLPPGDYLLAMAVTSLDLQKIGTRYYEFSLPDMSAFTDKLEITPLFSVKNFIQIDAPETTAEVHKNYFTYSVLQIEPKIDNIFSQGESLDVLFYVFGAQPNEEGQWDIAVNYEVFKGEERIIRFEDISYPSPLISQPLPMKRTFVIKSEEGEKKERKDLDPGQYTLSIEIKDNVTGKSLDKKFDFEIE
jgi:hypothetical protein